MAALDGGYYAIKGFLYQFDKSIIEIIDNPTKDILLENIQDINYDDFVLQIKHKETATFSFSKIKPAVVQLLDLFNSDKSKKYILYCYFRDKSSAKWKLTNNDLNQILSGDADNYTDEIKEKFIRNFVIQFSVDYENQFKQVIKKIKSSFGHKDNNSAIITHAIIRSNLLDIVVKQKPEKRKINKSELDALIVGNHQAIFEKSYLKYISKSKYEKEIKKRYFIFKKAAIENFERLFIVEYDNSGLTTLNKIIQSLSNKYFVFYDKGGLKSPPPYLCIRNINSDKLLELKKKLWNSNFRFNDGTCFNGDDFRLEQVKIHPQNKNDFKIKFVDEESLQQVLSNLNFDETFQFNLISEFIQLDNDIRQVKISINSLQQIINIIS